MDDTTAMRLAIDASQRALDGGDMPFGATLLSPSGALLHVAGNNQVTTGDCTGHAEIVLLREATARLGRDALRGSAVLASGEPCAMCSGALFWGGVSRLVYAASTQDIADALGGDVLPLTSREVLAGGSRQVRVEGPLLADEAVVVLRRWQPPPG